MSALRKRRAVSTDRPTVLWLQLELQTTQAVQSALMDRMASVYAMLQDLNVGGEETTERRSPLDDPYKAQSEMYERILRTMHQQIHILQTTSDSIIQSLKDHIQELLQDQAERRRGEDSSSNGGAVHPLFVTPERGKHPTDPPQPPLRHQSMEEGSQIMLLQDDLQRLRLENEQLRREQKEQMDHALEQRRQWRDEKLSLEEELERWKRGSDAQWEENRQAVTTCLDRVAILWDKAEESVQTLEGTMLRNSQYRADSERLSVQEAALAFQGQLKVSLMLMELKLRNNLSLLEMNVSFNDEGRVIFADDLRQELSAIQQESMTAIAEVEARSNVLMRKLNAQSMEESIRFREMHEADVAGLREMATRQEFLEEEITKIHLASTGGGGDGLSKRNGSGDILVVDPETVQLLNNEVHRVVERLKEKNEMIGRLQVEIEEHQVRERTLMEELKRYMSEQADQEKREQERIMQLNAHHREHYRYEDDEENSEEGSTSYEEKTIEGTIDEDEFLEEEGDEKSRKQGDVV